MAEQGFHLASPAFTNGNLIPQTHTCDGENSSPPLRWMHAPEGTQSFALVVEDPDAPKGTFTHWLLWNLPAGTTELPAGKAGLGVSGRNDFQHVGYGGPCPPPKDGPHRYFFKLFALDAQSLGLKEGARRDELLQAISKHTLGQAELMGRYQRVPTSF